MEIRAQYRYIIFNLFIILPNLDAKTFSLNEAIAAEARNQPSIQQPRLSDFSTLSDKSSFNQQRKKILITPPNRPKLLKTRLGSIRQTKQAKRQLDDYDEINPNFLPLFRSLSIILDNIIDSDPGEIIKLRNKFKRNPSPTQDTNDIVCNCAYRTTTESHISNSYEETIIPTTVSNQIETTPITSTTSTAPKTYRPTNHNVRNLRWNKNISLLPTRNSNSFRRNAYGIDERSSASNIRNVKRNFTRDQRNNEHDTRNRIVTPYTENSEENTECDTRNGASCNKIGGNIREDRAHTRNIFEKANAADKNFSTTSQLDERNLYKHEEQDQFADKGIEGEGANLLPDDVTRPHRSKLQNKTESTKAKDENDIAAIEWFIPSAKRISYGDSTNFTKNKKHSKPHETIIPHSRTLQNTNNKVVMIYDGYSVARDVNGENKMSEKAVQIHT